MFIFAAKLFIFGGSDISTAEIIDMENEHSYCKEPSSPLLSGNTKNSFGGLLNDASAEFAMPFICGGEFVVDDVTFTSGNCYTFDGDTFNFEYNYVLKERRSNAAAVVFEGRDILFSGGYNTTNGLITSKSSTEVYHQKSGVFYNSNDLPNATHGHCAVKFNETHALILGGYKTPNMSVLIKFEDDRPPVWSEGPEFNGGAAEYFTCTTFTRNGNRKVMIYSSESNGVNHRIQVLNLKTWHWEDAINLPLHDSLEHKLVTFENVPCVVGFGGRYILKYVCKWNDIEICEWKYTQQTFKHYRRDFTAMLIPKEMGDCELK